MAQSSEEWEHRPLSLAVHESLWIMIFYEPLNVDQNKIRLAEDNEGCVTFTKHNTVNVRKKHIDVKFQMVIDNTKSAQVEVKGVTT